MDALGTDAEANGHRSYWFPSPSRAPNSQSNDLPVIAPTRGEVWEEGNASVGRSKRIQEVQHLLEKITAVSLVQASGFLWGWQECVTRVFNPSRAKNKFKVLVVNAACQLSEMTEGKGLGETAQL